MGNGPSLATLHHTNTVDARQTLNPSLVAPFHPPRAHTYGPSALPVVKEESTRHSTQKQDDGQVELELLILILVGKSAATDTPR